MPLRRQSAIRTYTNNLTLAVALNAISIRPVQLFKSFFSTNRTEQRGLQVRFIVILVSLFRYRTTRSSKMCLTYIRPPPVLLSYFISAKQHSYFASTKVVLASTTNLLRLQISKKAVNITMLLK